MLSLLAALALPAAQDGTLAPDRATYQDLVKCAGVYQASAAEDAIDDAEARQAYATTAIGFQHLAYLYGPPLEIERAATDAAIEEAFGVARRPVMLARTLESLRRAQRALQTDREICLVILQRVSGTS